MSSRRRVARRATRTMTICCDNASARGAETALRRRMDRRRGRTAPRIFFRALPRQHPLTSSRSSPFRSPPSRPSPRPRRQPPRPSFSPSFRRSTTGTATTLLPHRHLCRSAPSGRPWRAPPMRATTRASRSSATLRRQCPDRRSGCRHSSRRASSSRAMRLRSLADPPPSMRRASSPPRRPTSTSASNSDSHPVQPCHPSSAPARRLSPRSPPRPAPPQRSTSPAPSRPVLPSLPPPAPLLRAALHHPPTSTSPRQTPPIRSRLRLGRPSLSGCARPQPSRRAREARPHATAAFSGPGPGQQRQPVSAGERGRRLSERVDLEDVRRSTPVFTFATSSPPLTLAPLHRQAQPQLPALR
ncbi:hypothetical protein DMC30DRAFT_5412 [Rhodotorula diobovata]|uniref:Uncharacterized protein n=1 Tax=Rhodotorula diobovata TaxID=5288 RepID=A0A5C5G8P2_9BASI|nr:hypothetical protein DMC30DRAFT_5412 [Rhodotorula diobovata]